MVGFQKQSSGLGIRDDIWPRGKCIAPLSLEAVSSRDLLRALGKSSQSLERFKGLHCWGLAFFGHRPISAAGLIFVATQGMGLGHLRLFKFCRVSCELFTVFTTIIDLNSRSRPLRRWTLRAFAVKDYYLATCQRISTGG